MLGKLGFRLERSSGNHHIYLQLAVGRPFPVQPDGKDAKRYQIRQLRDIIVNHRLMLGSDP
jgi:hypothetical protein